MLNPKESPEESYEVEKTGSHEGPQTQTTFAYRVERQHFHRNELFTEYVAGTENRPRTWERLGLHEREEMSMGTVTHVLERPGGVTIENALLQGR